MVLIETTNLANWEPITRENIEISIQGGSVQNFDLPMWIYDLAFEG